MFIVGVIVPAHAGTYYFTYTGSGDSAFGTSGSMTANGVITTGAVNGGGFDITGITGSFSFSATVDCTAAGGGFCAGGSTTTGTVSFSGSGIVGLVSTATCGADPICMLLGPDNIFYFPTTPYLDTAGLVFTDTSGDFISIFGRSSSDYGAGVYDPSEDFAAFDGTFTASTPLPASLPLLGSALCTGLFIAGWRRRHKSSSVAASA